VLRRWRLGQPPNDFPVIAGPGLRHDPSTFAVGRGEAGDAQGVTEGSATVFRHQGRIRDVDIRARLYPRVRQELSDLRQQRLPISTELSAPDGVRAGRDDLVCSLRSIDCEQSQKG